MENRTIVWGEVMAKSNGIGKLEKMSKSIVDQLDQDLHDGAHVFTQKKQEELAQILSDYCAQALRYIRDIDRDEREQAFLNWVLTMRVVEFKVAAAMDCLEDAMKRLNTGKFNRKTRDTVSTHLHELKIWLNVI